MYLNFLLCSYKLWLKVEEAFPGNSRIFLSTSFELSRSGKYFGDLETSSPYAELHAVTQRLNLTAKEKDAFLFPPQLKR